MFKAKRVREWPKFIREDTEVSSEGSSSELSVSALLRFGSSLTFWTYYMSCLTTNATLYFYIISNSSDEQKRNDKLQGFDNF